MTDSEFATTLVESAAALDVQLPSSGVVDQLTRFWRLLVKWSRTINLTALSLDPPSDRAIDRLFLEPLSALPAMPASAGCWYDLGSGGGSPAIPLKICRPDIPLLMVESRERKAVFLREAVRRLGLQHVEVLNQRFESLGIERTGTADVVSTRAVRVDVTLRKTVEMLLASQGRVLSFQSDSKSQFSNGLRLKERRKLSGDGSVLGVYVPRGTKR